MDLYLIRHADAGDPVEWSGADSDRPLSELGHRQARALGDALRARGLSIDAVCSSPLLRSRETAEDMLRAWPEGSPPELSELLAPGMLRRRKLSRLIAGLGQTSVAIVGHDPDLTEYLAWLLGTDEEQVRLAKGGAALLQFDGDPEKGEGVLAWMITPEWYLEGDGEFGARQSATFEGTLTS